MEGKAFGNEVSQVLGAREVAEEVSSMSAVWGTPLAGCHATARLARTYSQTVLREIDDSKKCAIYLSYTAELY